MKDDFYGYGKAVPDSFNDEAVGYALGLLRAYTMYRGRGMRMKGPNGTAIEIHTDGKIVDQNGKGLNARRLKKIIAPMRRKLLDYVKEHEHDMKLVLRSHEKAEQIVDITGDAKDWIESILVRPDPDFRWCNTKGRSIYIMDRDDPEVLKRVQAFSRKNDQTLGKDADVYYISPDEPDRYIAGYTFSYSEKIKDEDLVDDGLPNANIFLVDQYGNRMQTTMKEVINRVQFPEKAAFAVDTSLGEKIDAKEWFMKKAATAARNATNGYQKDALVYENVIFLDGSTKRLGAECEGHRIFYTIDGEKVSPDHFLSTLENVSDAEIHRAAGEIKDIGIKKKRKTAKDIEHLEGKIIKQTQEGEFLYEH